MSDAKKTVSMESLVYHEHYDASGVPVGHPPGETYEISDGQGMTADQLAESFIALRVAKRAETTPSQTAAAPVEAETEKSSTAVAPMTTEDLPATKSAKSKK